MRPRLTDGTAWLLQSCPPASDVRCREEVKLGKAYEDFPKLRAVRPEGSRPVSGSSYPVAGHGP